MAAAAGGSAPAAQASAVVASPGEDGKRSVRLWTHFPDALPVEVPDKRCGKVALITGITGQDGSYLTELLLSKGYVVHGIIRRSSSFNTGRIVHMYQDRHEEDVRLFLHYGDLADSSCLCMLMARIRPDEVYNLGAQSHVQVSFEMSEYTADVDALGTLRLLNAIRTAGLEDKTRLYQASTSELYGKVQEVPQSEKTPFYPRSPYAVAKLYSYWIVVNYREQGMWCCNGILFNHESPRRGPTFLPRKVSRAVARIHRGKQRCVYLGNLDARRDWGHARDYVEGMWRIMQQEKPDDFVLATGETHTVRELVEIAFRTIGITVQWRGEGVNEIGFYEPGKTGPAERPTCEEGGCEDLAGGTVAGEAADAAGAAGEEVVVRVDPRYFRPTEVELLIGDPAKAREELSWDPTATAFPELVREMVECDIQQVDVGNVNN